MRIIKKQAPNPNSDETISFRGQIVRFGCDQDTGGALSIWHTNDESGMDYAVKVIGDDVEFDPALWIVVASCQDGPFSWHLLDGQGQP